MSPAAEELANRNLGANVSEVSAADPRLSQVAQAAQLGGFRSKFVGRRAQLSSAYILGAFALAIPAAALALRSQGTPLWIYAAYASVLTPILLALAIRGVLRILRRTVQLHEAGIVYAEMGEIRSVRFEDVVALRQAVTRTQVGNEVNYSGALELLLKSGSPLSIRPNLDRIEDLLSELTESLAKPLTERMLQLLESGEEVDLGGIQLTSEGIVCGSTVEEWDMAEAIGYEGMDHEFGGGYSSTTDTFCLGEIEVPTGEILNYPFLQTVMKIMQERGEQAEAEEQLPGQR